MKHHKSDFLRKAKFFDVTDADDVAGDEDKDYYEDLLLEKLGSKWRKRPQRSKNNLDSLDHNGSTGFE